MPQRQVKPEKEQAKPEVGIDLEKKAEENKVTRHGHEERKKE